MENTQITDADGCMSWIFNWVDVLTMVILLDKSDLNFMRSVCTENRRGVFRTRSWFTYSFKNAHFNTNKWCLCTVHLAASPSTAGVQRPSFHQMTARILWWENLFYSSLLLEKREEIIEQNHLKKKTPTTFWSSKWELFKLKASV